MPEPVPGKPARGKREYGAVLLGGAVGAGLILLAVRQRWAQAVFTPPRPLSAQTVSVTGADLVPLAARWGSRRSPAWPR